jgi:hypothetical protein
MKSNIVTLDASQGLYIDARFPDPSRCGKVIRDAKQTAPHPLPDVALSASKSQWSRKGSETVHGCR